MMGKGQLARVWGGGEEEVPEQGGWVWVWHNDWAYQIDHACHSRLPSVYVCVCWCGEETNQI